MILDPLFHRTGAVHSEPPDAVPHLVRLARLPTAPAGYDWHSMCDFGVPPDMLGNGPQNGQPGYGDCVPVFALQTIHMLTNAIWGWDSWKPTTAQALALYAANTTPSFDPAVSATDVGTDITRFMTYWGSTGIKVTDQLTDVCLWTRVSVAEAPEAIAYTGPIGLTLNLPEAAQDTSNWAISPGPGTDWLPGGWGGHQVVAGRYASNGTGPKILTCITWGSEQEIHPDFLDRYLLGAKAPLSRLLLSAAGRSPAGLDWDAALAVQASLIV